MIELITKENTKVRLYDELSVKHIHSKQSLSKNYYRLAGELNLTEVQKGDIICTVDAQAYVERHRETGRLVRLRTGGYTDHNGTFRALKLIGVIKGNELFIVNEKASERVSDISERMPVRVAGLFAAEKKVFKAVRERKQELLF